MTIDLKTVKHISKVSRISIDEQKAKKLEKDLNAIFEWIEQLNQLNTDTVEPLTSIAETKLRFRKDQIETKNSIERIIKDPTYTIYSKGGAVKNGSKPTQNGQNNNVVPFPIKPGTPIDEWYKTASRDDVLELLNRVYDLKFLKGEV